MGEYGEPVVQVFLVRLSSVIADRADSVDEGLLPPAEICLGDRLLDICRSAGGSPRQGMVSRPGRLILGQAPALCCRWPARSPLNRAGARVRWPLVCSQAKIARMGGAVVPVGRDWADYQGGIVTTATPDTIVLIHGFRVTPRSWEHWIDHYEQKGFRVLAPAYPGFEVEVEALRACPDSGI
jgi:hypothetical protein